MQHGLLQAGLQAVDGRRCVTDHLRSAPLGGHPVWVAAIGKAAFAMAAGAHEVLGSAIERTLVITRDAPPAPTRAPSVTPCCPARPAMGLVTLA